jgi:hypothetical protein
MSCPTCSRVDSYALRTSATPAAPMFSFTWGGWEPVACVCVGGGRSSSAVLRLLPAASCSGCLLLLVGAACGFLMWLPAPTAAAAAAAAEPGQPPPPRLPAAAHQAPQPWQEAGTTRLRAAGSSLASAAPAHSNQSTLPTPSRCTAAHLLHKAYVKEPKLDVAADQEAARKDGAHRLCVAGCHLCVCVAHPYGGLCQGQVSGGAAGGRWGEGLSAEGRGGAARCQRWAGPWRARSGWGQQTPFAAGGPVACPHAAV